MFHWDQQYEKLLSSLPFTLPLYIDFGERNIQKYTKKIRERIRKRGKEREHRFPPSRMKASMAFLQRENRKATFKPGAMTTTSLVHYECSILKFIARDWSSLLSHFFLFLFSLYLGCILFHSELTYDRCTTVFIIVFDDLESFSFYFSFSSLVESWGIDCNLFSVLPLPIKRKKMLIDEWRWGRERCGERRIKSLVNEMKTVRICLKIALKIKWWTNGREGERG